MIKQFRNDYEESYFTIKILEIFSDTGYIDDKIEKSSKEGTVG